MKAQLEWREEGDNLVADWGDLVFKIEPRIGSLGNTAYLYSSEGKLICDIIRVSKRELKRWAQDLEFKDLPKRITEPDGWRFDLEEAKTHMRWVELAVIDHYDGKRNVFAWWDTSEKAWVDDAKSTVLEPYAWRPLSVPPVPGIATMREEMQ